MVAYAEARRGSPLRWFQWLTAQRRYEVKADGSWCWPLVFESVSRQQGKSVTLSEDAAWYAQGTTGPELLLHAAHRVRTSLKVQSNMWHWAESQGFEVRRLLGDSHIVWPNGSDWQTIALESAYGAPAHRLLVDEAWALDPVKFWNSLFPTLGDRENPQVLMWSTANPDDRGLVTDLRADESVCRMEWGALPNEDPLDPRTWQASSAYWGPGREALMRMAATKPGFAEEWLNVWPEMARGQTRTPFPNWGSLPVVEGDPPFGALVVLDEHIGGAGAAVAAYHAGGFWYRDVADLRAAVALAKEWTDREVIVGYSLRAAVENLSLPFAVAYGAKETALGTPLLLEAVKAASIAHEHQQEVTAQFEGMRTRMSDAGVMSLSARDSAGPVMAGKLLAWALWFERSRPTEVPAVW